MVEHLYPLRLQIHFDAVLQLRQRLTFEIVIHQKCHLPRRFVDLYQVCLSQVAERRPRATGMATGARIKPALAVISILA